ncbi:MAG: phosphoribosylformylglycinamidine synthase subunit PurL [Verrucomicrobia bacterium]|nr:MAG: phosphoribosylformylglycinamidine synthase subunit PurL [Verrucomicrobiota bacterium]
MTSEAPTVDPVVTPEVVARHGLTSEEFERIKKILGREPNFTELGIFSVMWSEHCSYKNSKKELKKFPTTGPNILVKAGEENAGVVDIGDGWAIAFKMESHNHPSAIEPFQGAATGVGGIIRDIFTMGARPEFCLNSLRFGPITEQSNIKLATGRVRPTGGHQTSNIAANRRLFSGVVSGIAHYGNCVGIPTIGGEIYFDESFDGNPLVNVFCLGVLRHEQVARGTAKGVGNPVFYVGAETGRDGLAGAAFASRELTEQSREDRPAVQVGDPFKEKLLLEACLELLDRDAVAGIQDMGAAGLTCSTCETASRGGSGIEIDLAKVPKREPGMTPYEILLSESQERMLIIAKRGKENLVRKVFEKWDVPCAEIGHVTDDGMMRARNNSTIAAEIPAKALAEEAPIYSPEVKPVVAAIDDRGGADSATIDSHEALRQLLREPTIASKNWVYRQYDHTVRTGTIVKPGSDAAVFFVRYADKILAATTDCNSLFNFGNPYKPENFWQLREAVEGIAEACRAFGTPVAGGNVSLYNESPAGTVDPTPTIGMVGLIEDEKHITTQWFKEESDTIILVGETGTELGGSQFLKACYGRKIGPPPNIDLEHEIKIQNTARELIRAGLVKSAHDCSEGGLAVALTECCFNPEKLLGAEIDLKTGETPVTAALFNESQSRIVISVDSKDAQKTTAILQQSGIPFQRLGQVEGNELRIRVNEKTFRWPIADLYDGWFNAIRRAVEDETERIPSL